jgi:hypothetical protein
MPDIDHSRTVCLHGRAQRYRRRRKYCVRRRSIHRNHSFPVLGPRGLGSRAGQGVARMLVMHSLSAIDCARSRPSCGVTSLLVGQQRSRCRRMCSTPCGTSSSRLAAIQSIEEIIRKVADGCGRPLLAADRRLSISWDTRFEAYLRHRVERRAHCSKFLIRVQAVGESSRHALHLLRQWPIGEWKTRISRRRLSRLAANHLP